MSWKPVGGRPSLPSCRLAAISAAWCSTSSRRSTVGLVDALEHLAERGQAAARLGREVRPAVERAPVGQQEDRHRPAALARLRDDRAHVEAVDVGALLAIDLDRDEVVVHELRRGLVLERLALHDVAPVAGRVADREQHGPVERAREARTPPRPRAASRPGCRRAAAGTGWSRRRAGCDGRSRRGRERALDVPDDVLDVLEPDRDADHVLGHAARGECGVVEAAVRGRRRDGSRASWRRRRWRDASRARRPR